MRTVGYFIREARQRRKLSLVRLAQKTKIKSRYIAAIEKEQWQTIPNFVTASGFVRNIAGALEIDTEHAVALLRRDFQEPRQASYSVSTPRVVWTPKTTLILLSLVTVFLLTFYLVRQYLTYVAPPPLSARMHKNGGNAIEVSGNTDKEASVLVNNEPVLVTENGTFQLTITADSGQSLTIEARSRGGKTTKREIVVP